MKHLRIAVTIFCLVFLAMTARSGMSSSPDFQSHLNALLKERDALGMDQSASVRSKYAELTRQIDQIENEQLDRTAVAGTHIKPKTKPRPSADATVHASAITPDPIKLDFSSYPVTRESTASSWPVGLVMLAAAFYFIPALIAWRREKQNTTAITVLNLFLGWTVLGWVVALVWALIVEVPRSSVNDISESDETGLFGNVGKI